MSNFVGLHTALTGIRAAQFGLDTTANNISNASTEGYTRQRVTLRPSLSYQSTAGPMGTGVTISGIARMRDGFLDARARTGLGQAAFHGTQALLLARTETVMAEPDNGISSVLNQLWDSFEDLALAPQGGAQQRQVVASMQALASRIQSVSTGWAQLEADTTIQLDTLTREANQLLAQVAELNKVIPVQTALQGGPPNDLMDTRDAIADRLAELLGTTAVTNADGVMTISVGGVDLVRQGEEHREVAHDQTGRFTVTEAGAVVGTGLQVTGDLGGMADFIAVKLPAQREALDTFVAELATALNTQHAAGAGTGPADLFVSSDGGAITAATITVDAAFVTDPSLLRSAAPGGGLHDATNAHALAGLRTQRLGADEQTLAQRLNGTIINLAAEVAKAGANAKAEHTSTAAAIVARQSAHGVSLDEDMTALVQYQRSLEAISRVMTTIDEALNTLINRTGIVGR
jgi:flagellar hook-associated protein 1